MAHHNHLGNLAKCDTWTRPAEILIIWLEVGAHLPGDLSAQLWVGAINLIESSTGLVQWSSIEGSWQCLKTVLVVMTDRGMTLSPYKAQDTPHSRKLSDSKC